MSANKKENVIPRTPRLYRNYPRQISIESFRKPNLELIADVLYWLTLRLDPSATITLQMERKRDRIKLPPPVQ